MKDGQRVRKFLLLSSYCGQDNLYNCTDDNPCLECIMMCNTFQTKGDKVLDSMTPLGIFKKD